MIISHVCPLCKSYKVKRSIYSSLLKVEDGGHGPKKASKRLTSLQAMRPATAKRDAAPPPDYTRYKV